ncbi:MAG: hypothetical protein ACREOK_07900 [Gemmatimonadaceae bacterium]
MKKTLPLVAALFTLACSGTEPGPLRLTMSLDRAAIAMDDSIRIVLSVVNASSRPVMVYPASAYGPCGFSGFEVYDRTGRRALEGYFCIGAAAIYFVPDPVSLNPGESMQITRWWHPAQAYIEGEPIAPGLYYLRGAVVTLDQTVETPAREVIVGG